MSTDTPVDPLFEDPAHRYSTPQTFTPGRRRLTIEFPGNVTVTGPKGYYAGCRAVQFANGFAPVGLSKEDVARLASEMGLPEKFPWQEALAVDQVNAYFAHRANLAFVEALTSAGAATITGFLTRILDGEDLEDYQESGRELEVMMAERKKARDKKRAEAAAAEAKAEAERAEDLEVGKKARAHNLFGKLKALEAKVEELEKEKTALLRRTT